MKSLEWDEVLCIWKGLLMLYPVKIWTQLSEPKVLEWFQKYKADISNAPLYVLFMRRQGCETLLKCSQQMPVSCPMPWSSQSSTIRKVNLTSSLIKWDVWNWINRRKLSVLCVAEGSISRGAKSGSTGLLRHTVNTWERWTVCFTPDRTVDEVCYHLSASSAGETPKDFDYCHGIHFSLLELNFLPLRTVW